MYIVHNLRCLRESKGWSQEALGFAAGGLSQGTVSLLESNKQKASWKQIINFAQAFDISPEQLIKPENHTITDIEILKEDYHNYSQDYAIYIEGELSVLRHRISAQEEEIHSLREEIKIIKRLPDVG